MWRHGVSSGNGSSSMAGGSKLNDYIDDSFKANSDNDGKAHSDGQTAAMRLRSQSCFRTHSPWCCSAQVTATVCRRGGGGDAAAAQRIRHQAAHRHRSCGAEVDTAKEAPWHCAALLSAYCRV